MIRRMRRLLVRLLRPHLSDAALLAFDAEALARAARRRAVRHLRQCERCRARLDGLRVDLSALQDLFQKASDAPPGAGQNWPALLEAIRRLERSGGTRTASPTVLAPYLGRLADSAARELPPGLSAADVLEALLGGRASACLSGGLPRQKRAARKSLRE